MGSIEHHKKYGVDVETYSKPKSTRSTLNESINQIRLEIVFQLKIIPSIHPRIYVPFLGFPTSNNAKSEIGIHEHQLDRKRTEKLKNP